MTDNEAMLREFQTAIDSLRKCVYWLHSREVLDVKTIEKLYDQIDPLYDIIAGDPIGTYQQRLHEQFFAALDGREGVC